MSSFSKCFAALFPATDIKKEKLIVNMAVDPGVTEYRRKALAACYSFDQIEKAPLRSNLPSRRKIRKPGTVRLPVWFFDFYRGI